MIPDFDYQVIDLTIYEDYQIKGMVYLRVAALIMKYYFREDLNHKLPEILSLLSDLIQQKTTIDFLEVVLEYIVTNKNIDEESMVDNIEKAFHKKGDDFMISLTEKWMNKGKKSGKVEILYYLFEERFGKVPQKMKKQITQVDDKRLEDLTRSFLSFKSINDYYLWWDKH